MAKKMLVVPEDKEVIQRIKKRYSFLRKNIRTYGEEVPIKVKNRILKTAIKNVGFNPDVNVTLIEGGEQLSPEAEKILANLLKHAALIHENKYRTVAQDMDVHERMGYVESLCDQMMEAARDVSVEVSKKGV